MGDGYFSGTRVSYATTSNALANDLLYLLLTLEIVARVHKKKQNKNSKGKRSIYIIEFSRKEDVLRFLKKVKFTNKPLKKRVKGPEIFTYNVVSFKKDELLKNFEKLTWKYSHLKRDLKCSKFYLKRVTRDPNVVCSENLKNFANGDFYIDEVKKVEEIILTQPEYVYDLSVNPTENFVGGFGGVLLHNTEAKALYEAMRVGALANAVLGTIHGDSAYGVFDRVVNDLGVTATSFKATDLIVISGMIKTADGLHRMRRVLEVTEVRKHWKNDPMDEKGFVNLMEYSAKEDKLKPTDTLISGESNVINEIAKRVKEWHGNWDAVWENIELRGRIKQTMVDYARKINNKEILEANWVVQTNDMFHIISDRVREEIGYLDSKEIYNRWDEWFRNELKTKLGV